MDLPDLHVMLVQELGWGVSLHDGFIAGHWDVSGRKVQVIFHVDHDDGTVYVSTRFDHPEGDDTLNEALLHENLQRAFVKFCKDTQGHVILLVELTTSTGPDQLREAVYRLCKAAAWYINRADPPEG